MSLAYHASRLDRIPGTSRVSCPRRAMWRSRFEEITMKPAGQPVSQRGKSADASHGGGDLRGADRRHPANTGWANWPPPRLWLIFLFILGLNFLLTELLAPHGETPITVPYTVFKQQVTSGNVESIYSKGAMIEGRFAKAITYPPPGVKHALGSRSEPRTAANFKTTLPAFVDLGLDDRGLLCEGHYLSSAGSRTCLGLAL